MPPPEPPCAAWTDCPYSAVKLYRDRKAWVAGFDVPEGKTLEEVIEEELKTGRYGRCVYHCDNDVNDLQKVQIRMMSLNGTKRNTIRKPNIQTSSAN